MTVKKHAENEHRVNISLLTETFGTAEKSTTKAPSTRAFPSLYLSNEYIGKTVNFRLNGCVLL